jgi:hypothetical protein
VPRVILLLVIVFTLVVLVRRAQQQPPHKRRAAYLQIIVGSAVIGVVILTLMGKMHWVGAALTGLLVAARQLLPVLVRLLPALGGLRASGARSSSKQSEVASRIIKMTLDHDSGDLSGVVLESTFKGWLLSELNRQQLDELLSYCQHEDTDSAQLLASYLEQRFPEDAQDREETDRGGENGASPSSRAEALAVLGLQDDATEEDIIAAHRALIQKCHPDRGGNDYLAAKINQAKDQLLG